jgi:WD40 repeat protein
LAEARQEVIELFTGTLGYTHHSDLGLNPTKAQLTSRLRAFCKDPARREDDLIVMYLSCHGEVLDGGNRHVLLPADTEPDDIPFTSLATGELARIILEQTKVRRALLLLDACYAGAGGHQIAAAAIEHLTSNWLNAPDAGLVIVSSAQPHQQAQAGLFPQLLKNAVSAQPVAGHAPAILAIPAMVGQMNKDPGRPEFQCIGLTMLGLSGEAPPFFANPRHDPQLSEVDLALQQAAAFDEQDRLRETEFTTRLLVRAMGYHGDAAVPAWWFTGRHAALKDLAAWLNAPCENAPVCRVVTAAPGSGKTAVLGLIAALTHPERRRTVPFDTLGIAPDLIETDTLDVAIYAQRLADTEVLHAIAAAARVRADTVGELLDALDHQDRARPFTLLIDALDEAATPESLCTTILRPLIEHAHGRIRLLLGTRPYLLPRLDLDQQAVIDLDAPRYTDPEALRTYTMRTLLEAHRTSPYRQHPHALRPVAQAVADAAGESFLVARLAAGTLAAAETVVPDPQDPAWRASLPRHAAEAMREDLAKRLGPNAQRATDLLRPLAYAQGQGLPWEDIWAPLATEISQRPYSDEDLLWLRRTAGSYVVEATENGRSAYRLYHQAMAEHLQDGVDATAVHSAYTRVLTSLPFLSDATRDWSRAHPYTLAHLAYHASRAGLLDQIMAESEYLIYANPSGLAPHLHRTHSDDARLAAAVYRTSLGLHYTADPSERSVILALDAARAGAISLQRNLTRRITPNSWTPIWATGSTFSAALRNALPGHESSVRSVACTEIDGVPVAVTGGDDKTVRVWNLRDGTPIGRPLTGHTDRILAVACTEIAGVPVTVTGGGAQVRVWNLRDGSLITQTATRHSGRVMALACTEIDGVPVAVTGGDDKTVRVWNLRDGTPIGRPLTGHDRTVRTVTCAEIDGIPVAVTGGDDTTVRVWNLRDATPIGRPLTGHDRTVRTVTCTEIDGVPVIVTGGDDKTVQVWNLRDDTQIRRVVAGHGDWVLAVACTSVEGVPVAVTGGGDETVRIWDLRNGTPIGRPLTGHMGQVEAVACTEIDGVPVAITGGEDTTVRVWDLRDDTPSGQGLPGHTGWVQSVACTQVDGIPVAVTGGDDETVRIWNLRNGTPFGQPLTGHRDWILAVACTEIDGVPVAVAGGIDEAIWIWDLRTGKPFRQALTGHTDWVQSVACTQVDGIPVAVTGGDDETVRIWNLRNGTPFGQPLTGHTASVRSVACTEIDGTPVAVTGSRDTTVRVWNLRDGSQIGPILSGHTDRIRSVACAEIDGTPIAVTGSSDATVRVWNLREGTQIGQPIAGHIASVRSVACTQISGTPIAITGSEDATVQFWDLRTRTRRASLTVPSPNSIAVTSAGDLVVGFHRDIALYSRKAQSRRTMWT